MDGLLLLLVHVQQACKMVYVLETELAEARSLVMQ